MQEADLNSPAKGKDLSFDMIDRPSSPTAKDSGEEVEEVMRSEHLLHNHRTTIYK